MNSEAFIYEILPGKTPALFTSGLFYSIDDAYLFLRVDALPGYQDKPIKAIDAINLKSQNFKKDMAKGCRIEIVKLALPYAKKSRTFAIVGINNN